VTPDAGSTGYYSNWVGPDAETANPPRWADFHLDELPELLGGEFRLGDRWVVAGVSMGGYGAMVYAAARPERFHAALSMSGLLHTSKPGVRMFISAGLLWRKERYDALWGRPWRPDPRWIEADPITVAEKLHGTAIYLCTGDGTDGPLGPAPRGLNPVEKMCTKSTVEFAARLDELNIQHTLRRYTGSHDWPYWDRELELAWPFLRANLGL